MRSIRLGVVWLAVAILALAEGAGAQSTTGTISGRVVDTQDRSVPGVTVTVESPNLQGVRNAVTSENGDYIFTLLPSGQYTIRFELSGFQNQERVVTVAPTQVVPIDVTMGLAGVTETVDVVGRAADVLTQTAQVATNFSADLIATLPTNRTLAAAMLLAPSVHATGPSGNFSIAGSMSFENLFLVNGVTVNENLRGQALNVYIEDAIQETTIATAGVSAEYGRFGGGVVNVITKSGGNLFSGSFRDSVNSDRWRALTPARTGDGFADTNKVRDASGALVDAPLVPTYEYTFGGPVVRDRLWFFTAGRFQKQTFNRQLIDTLIPYTATNDSKRYEANATYSLNSNHRFQGSFIKESLDQLNNTFSQTASMDLASLEDRSTPQDLFTLTYSGILTPSFFIEGRYSQRNFTFAGSGSKFTDPIKGTLLINTLGRRFWSPTFCGVCTDEQRDNQDIFVKGSYFLSTSDYGSHNVVVGYDNFDDIRAANNHQSGSDYRFLNLTTTVRGTEIIPAVVSGTTQIQWNPIFVKTQGSDFRTHSVFANDNWRVNDRITANIGLRFDKNHGVNGNGSLVADTMGFSPRLGVVYDPTGAGQWSVTGSVAKYLAALSNNIADVSSPAGNSDTYRFVYRGPSLNTDPAGPNLSTEQVIQSVFDWFNANGGANIAPTGTPSVRGVSPLIGDDLKSPHTWEYSAGLSRQYGARAAIRTDFTYRDYNDFYVFRTDSSTGRVADDRSFAPAAVRGKAYDLALVENTNILERRYAGLSVQSQYRFHTRFDVGGSYTISRAWGNVDGENVTSGPLSDSALQYPEYKQAAWNYPEGDLSIDQRHRARLWLNVGIPRVDGLTLSLLQALESGAPYGASNQNAALFNGVNPQPSVTLPAGHPGYVTPPDGAATQYFFTDRDAFRFEAHRRTDLAANYRFDIPAGGRRIGLFVQAQIINVFNQFDLCACGDTVFNNGGTVQNGFINTNVRTNVGFPTQYTAFNPFTTQPQEGVHWAKDPAFGKALSRFAYTTPRMFRIGFGVRF